MQRLQSSAEREWLLWAAVCLLFGMFLLFVTPIKDFTLQASCTAGFVVSAFGLFLKMPWARYTAIGSLCAFTLATLIEVPRLNAPVYFLFAATTVCLPFLWMLGRDSVFPDFEMSDDENEESTLTSLVALLREPCYLDATILARLASQAWDRDVVVDDEGDAPYAVTGDAPHFLLRADSRFFVVHSLDQPYFEDPDEFASQVLESRIGRAILEHNAWVSIDLLETDESEDDQQISYQLIARLLAELIDDSCLAICCPENGTIHPYRSEFNRKLLAENPLAELSDESFPPVIHIDENDPRMQHAVETAQRTWPDFVRAFENRSTDQTFSVKAPLCDNNGCEQIWLSVTALENDMVYGIVGNEPVHLTRFKLDDRARVACKDISDWMYFEDGTLHGGFTIEVLSRMAAEHARRNNRSDES